MKNLKRTRYWTMNSWNRLSAPAYNLKIYNVVDNNLQDKVFELMDSPDFYNEINALCEDFPEENPGFNVGFNGRSGGYLVLYPEKGNHIEDKDVPASVLKNFRSLAVGIVKHVEYLAKNCNIQEETYTVEKTRKTIV